VSVHLSDLVSQFENRWAYFGEIRYFQVLLKICQYIFKVEVFWVMTPCSVVVGYQRLRGPCCPYLYTIMTDTLYEF
jgi:hypothetical protein